MDVVLQLLLPVLHSLAAIKMFDIHGQIEIANANMLDIGTIKLHNLMRQMIGGDLSFGKSDGAEVFICLRLNLQCLSTSVLWWGAYGGYKPLEFSAVSVFTLASKLQQEDEQQIYKDKRA
ncbi:hypothetical protein ACJX0J_007876, partial [Zea mays]